MKKSLNLLNYLEFIRFPEYKIYSNKNNRFNEKLQYTWNCVSERGLYLKHIFFTFLPSLDENINQVNNCFNIQPS